MHFHVVDDNRLLNRFLTTYLRGKGHAATSGTDFGKVVSWLQINPCDALVIDPLGLQGDQFGLAYLATVRKAIPHLKIVLFPGIHRDELPMDDYEKLGITHVVSKGKGPSEIYAALMSAMENTETAK